MDWPPSHVGLCPGDPFCKPLRLTPLRLPWDVPQAVVESLRIDRYARVFGGTLPEQTVETGRYRGLVLHLCDGAIAIAAANFFVAARLCPFTLPPGHRCRHCMACPWCRLIRPHLLSFHLRCRDDFRKLSVSNNWIAISSIPCRGDSRKLSVSNTSIAISSHQETWRATYFRDYPHLSGNNSQITNYIT